MSGSAHRVRGYLAELKLRKESKPGQIRDALDIYLDLWDKAIERGIVSEDDGIDEALRKIDAAGGLYAAAGQEG